MKIFGLIGYPLSHSFSGKYFAEKFRREGIADCRYELFELQSADELPALLARQPEIRGLNVTIPHKQAVIPFLHSLHPAARKTGAVNVIKVLPGGKLHGYNSDYLGFSLSLQRFLGGALQPGLQALVLGSGGASLAVKTALQDLDISFKTVSRTPGKGQWGYADITPEVLAAHRLVVNTTPLGMHPAVDTAPVLPYKAAGPLHFFYDLVYNPEQTRFMQLGKQAGASTINGLEMLHLQAEESWRIWNGRQA